MSDPKPSRQRLLTDRAMMLAAFNDVREAIGTEGYQLAHNVTRFLCLQPHMPRRAALRANLCLESLRVLRRRLADAEQALRAAAHLAPNERPNFDSFLSK